MIRFDAWARHRSARIREIGREPVRELRESLGRAEIAEHGEAGVAGFLRVELQAEDRAALDDAGERVRPCRRRRRGRLADRRRERVREVGLRPGATPARIDDGRVGFTAFQPTCGTLNSAQLRRGTPRSQSARASAAAGQQPEPGEPRRLGAPLEQELQPEADAEQRLAGVARRQDRLAPRRVEHAVASKWPTPGTIRPSAPANLRRRLRREHLGAGRGQRLAHGRQVAGAIVDQRDDSQQPLRARQHPLQPPVLRAGDAQRARERLEHRFDRGDGSIARRAP